MTPDQVDTITAKPCADVETWIVALNNRHACPYSYFPRGQNAAWGLAKAYEYYAEHEPSALPVVAMTYEQFERWERARMAERMTAEATTEEQFSEMLEVLPPKAWMNRSGFESFLMSEHTTGSYTQQFARVGNLYATKLVDAADKTTWLTTDDVIRVNTQEKAQ